MNWYLEAFTQKYADFSGRSRRTEYWMFMLFHILAIFALAIFSAILNSSESLSVVLSVLLIIYVLGSFIPALAITIRRLHDTGKSGWFYLLTFIPYIGGIILLVFTAQDSENMHNKWGPNPKNVDTNEINMIGKQLDEFNN